MRWLILGVLGVLLVAGAIVNLFVWRHVAEPWIWFVMGVYVAGLAYALHIDNKEYAEWRRSHGL